MYLNIKFEPMLVGSCKEKNYSSTIYMTVE